MNGNGVYFAPGAQVNVGSLVASSLEVDPNQFMSGRYLLKQGKGAGSIINRGLIEAAKGGFVGLAGSEVSNEGMIHAQAGRVQLASGAGLEVVDFDGDGLLRFAVKEGVLEGSGKVSNSGTIEAAGGEVLLTGAKAREVLEGVVSNSGVIRAGRINRTGGRILLEATGGAAENSGELSATGETGGSITIRGSSVTHSGTADASGTAQGGTLNLEATHPQTGEQIAAQAAEQSTDIGGLLDIEGNLQAASSQGQGGDITLQAATLTLQGQSNLDVSGAKGGGRIRAGGGRQGQDSTLRNARTTTVEQGAGLRADALEQGDGGEVIVWANEETRYQGAISARGGPQGGAGGFAEVSAKQLWYQGSADLRAPHGKWGTLLLDPVNISICHELCDPDDDELGSNTFTDTQISEALATADAEYSTTKDGTESGDITVEDSDVSISWTAGTTLTLQADRNITLAGKFAGGSSGTQTLNLQFGRGSADSTLNFGAVGFTNLDVTATGTPATDTTVIGSYRGSAFTVGSTATTVTVDSTTVTLTNIDHLTGNTGADTFNINASYARRLSGGGGMDVFNINALQTGGLSGGEGIDVFIIGIAGAAGSLDGGPGSADLLRGTGSDPITYIFTVTTTIVDGKEMQERGGSMVQTRSGTDVTLADFSNIENLGGAAGTDTLDLSSASGDIGQVSLSPLANANGYYGYAGELGFDGIDTLIGPLSTAATNTIRVGSSGSLTHDAQKKTFTDGQYVLSYENFNDSSNIGIETSLLVLGGGRQGPY